jgi:hypothetical protein
MLLWPRCRRPDGGAAVEKILDLSVLKKSWNIEVNHVTSEPLRAEKNGDGHSSGPFNPLLYARPTQTMAFSSQAHIDLMRELGLVVRPGRAFPSGNRMVSNCNWTTMSMLPRPPGVFSRSG